MIAGGAIALLGLFLVLVGVPKFVDLGFATAGFVLTPRSFPRMVSILLTILGAVVAGRGFFQHRRDKRTGTQAPVIEFYTASAAVALLCLFFLLAIKPLGYPITNALIMFGMYYLSGGKKILTSIATALIFTVISTWFFVFYLQLSIPLGPLAFLR